MSDTIKQILKIILRLIVSFITEFLEDENTKKISSSKPKTKTIAPPKENSTIETKKSA